MGHANVPATVANQRIASLIARLPLDILPGSVEAASQIKSRYSFDGLKNTFQSHPVTGTIIFIITGICAGLGVVKLVWPELFAQQ